MTVCIKCREPSAGLFRGDDGRHRARCAACGYEWGPFVSSSRETPDDRDDRDEPAGTTTSQPALDDFAAGN